MSGKKKAAPRDKVTLERDPVSHKPVVMLRLTPAEARVLRYVCDRVGGIGRSRDTISMIGSGVTAALWRTNESDVERTSLTTCIPPERYKYLELGRMNDNALYIYDVDPDKEETRTDPRAPVEITKTRAIELE